MKCVITVLGKDSTGIVAAIATALAECSVNIDDISQTILEDRIFSMTMMVTLNPEVADFNAVQTRLERVQDEIGLQVIIRPDSFPKHLLGHTCARGSGRSRGVRANAAVCMASCTFFS